MKKNIRVILFRLGILAAIGGVIFTGWAVKSGIDSVLLDGKPVERVTKTEFDELVVMDGGSYRLTKAYKGTHDGTILEDLYRTIHEMSHNVVIAKEKWGNIPMTESTINTTIIQVLASEIAYKEKDTLLNFLVDWKAGDFKEAHIIHNYVWLRQEGTVGRATGVNPDFKADWIR